MLKCRDGSKCFGFCFGFFIELVLKLQSEVLHKVFKVFSVQFNRECLCNPHS